MDADGDADSKKCAAPGCAAPPPATKRCPQCREAGVVEGSYFCDRVRLDCLGWVESCHHQMLTKRHSIEIKT